MKKIFICLLISLTFTLQAFADGYLPKYSDSIKYFGEGVFYAPKVFKIYKEPGENSQVLEEVNWNNISDNNAEELKLSDNAVAFIPEKNIVLFTVLEENNDWCKIVYNQNNGDSGWVKISKNAKFSTWRDLFNKYGRIHGMYLWRNTPKESQVLRTSPDVNTPPNNNFIYAKMITLQLLSGNWMLIKVIDFDNVSKVGWFQWRTTEGKLLLFPMLTEAQ